MGTSEMLTCPLCGETDFDRYGLACHYGNEWCDAVTAEIATGPPERRPQEPRAR